MYSQTMPYGFNERRAAQVAAFFSHKEGGEISVLKLAKLIYLSDRMSMAASGFPITNDNLVSMPHGPVNSLTLNFIDGNIESELWSDLISDRASYKIGLSRELNENDTDELSDFDVDILETVWAEFGHLNKYAIRDWTHKNCPEWEDPGRGCTPIPYERVLKFLGVEDAADIAEEIEAKTHIDRVFTELRA